MATFSISELQVVSEQPRITAFVLAFVVIVTAVALFAGFYDLVTAEGTFRSCEAIALLFLFDGIQNVRNIANGTARELAVVRTVTARR